MTPICPKTLVFGQVSFVFVRNRISPPCAWNFHAHPPTWAQPESAISSCSDLQGDEKLGPTRAGCISEMASCLNVSRIQVCSPWDIGSLRESKHLLHGSSGASGNASICSLARQKHLNVQPSPYPLLGGGNGVSCAFGARLVRVWRAFCARLVRIRCAFGACSVADDSGDVWCWLCPDRVFRKTRPN